MKNPMLPLKNPMLAFTELKSKLEVWQRSIAEAAENDKAYRERVNNTLYDFEIRLSALENNINTNSEVK